MIIPLNIYYGQKSCDSLGRSCSEPSGTTVGDRWLGTASFRYVSGLRVFKRVSEL